MLMDVQVFFDGDRFYTNGLYLEVVYEQLEMIGYETRSKVIATYEGNSDDNIAQGDLLADGDDRGIRLLHVYDKLNDRDLWINMTKEQFVDLGDMRESIIINNYAGGGTGGATPGTTSPILYPWAWMNTVEDGLTSVPISNIDAARTLIIQLGNDLLSEYKIGMPYDPADPPVGTTFKVDKPTHTLYLGTPWALDTRLFIVSEQNLALE